MKRIAIAALAGLLTAAAPAGAASLCGTVRDGQTTSPIGVDLTLPGAPPLAVYPNPARTRVTLEFDLPGPQTAALAVFDAAGRLLRGWSGPAPGETRLDWDLRDAAGPGSCPASTSSGCRPGPRGRCGGS